MPLPAQSVHEGRVQDAQGNARPAGTKVDVLRQLEDGSSAPATLSVFNATTKRFELATNNRVATVGNTGRIRFHAPPGHYRVTWAGPPPPVPSEPLDLRLTLPVTGSPCAWPDARADAFALPANDTARLQDEIDRLAAAGGGVLQLAARTYWITSLRLPASVSLEGVDVTVTRLTQLDGVVGALLVSLPQAGKVQLLRRLHLFGASVGFIAGQGEVSGQSRGLCIGRRGKQAPRIARARRCMLRGELRRGSLAQFSPGAVRPGRHAGYFPATTQFSVGQTM